VTAPRIALDGLDARAGELRWRFVVAYTSGPPFIVHVGTNRSGHVMDVQAGDSAGTTGDSALDEQLADLVRRLLVHHRAMRALDRLDREPRR